MDEIEQQSSDIDWFFTDGKFIGFVASGGGKLPDTVANSMDDLEILTSFFRNQPYRSDVFINPALVDIIGSVNDRYLSDFVDMTKRGLYSFDKTILNNYSDSKYHLVSQPKNPYTIDELPIEIASIISRIISNESIERNFDERSFN